MTGRVNEPDWTWKKPAVYCRPHGRRIKGWLQGTGCCDRCLNGVLDRLSILLMPRRHA